MVLPDTVLQGVEALAVNQPESQVLPVPERFDPRHIHPETAGTSVSEWVQCFQNQPHIEDYTYHDCGFANVIAFDQDMTWIDSLNSINGLPLSQCEEESFDLMDRSQARALLKSKLMTSMAYSSALMPEDVAEAWTASFVESFPEEGCQWYGNYEIDSSSWNPVTEATFDAMVVVVDRTSMAIGYFLITDED